MMSFEPSSNLDDRITVETALGFLSAGESPAAILAQYRSLEPADIDA